VRWGTSKTGPATWGRRPGGLDISLAAAVGVSGLSALPGYANISELATGTFATVYRATELGTGRPVALKVLRVAGTSRQMVEVFNQELEALSLLSNHPNVTTLYRTFITPEGRPVLVLELCKGSLAQRVRQNGPMPPQEVVRVGVKVAGALETAHRVGLLHRDMKPQNILVSEFDEPVLADFGVAALQVAAQSTEGLFGFTTLHAPPEALEGQPLSPAADTYGLASSMYQLLLGHGPFAAFDGEAPASVILRILRDPAPRPPVVGVPIALADLLEDALAKDPARRPQSALAFAEALREVEALGGWPQTPYVVWGPPTTSPEAGVRVAEGAPVGEGTGTGQGAAAGVAAAAAGQDGPGAPGAPGLLVTQGTGLAKVPDTGARLVTAAGTLAAWARTHGLEGEGNGLTKGAEAGPAQGAQPSQPACDIPPPPAGPRLPGIPSLPAPDHNQRAVITPVSARRNVVLPALAGPAAPQNPPGGNGPEAEARRLPEANAPAAVSAAPEPPRPNAPAALSAGRARAFTGTIPLTGWLGRGTSPRLKWGDPFFGPNRGYSSADLERAGLAKPLSVQAPLRGSGRGRASPSSQTPSFRWQNWWAIPLTLAGAVGVLIGLGIAALLGHL
jgi:hypothetical protein